MFAEAVTLTFISQHPDWVYMKQQAALALKARPYYDAIFLDPAHRDDPDSILEGRSALWHYNRVTLAIDASDYILGEEGNELFAVDHDVPYDSITTTLQQAPLTAVNVNGHVTWTQRETGLIDFGPTRRDTQAEDPATISDYTFFSYTGGSIISSWPQTLTDLGGGWRVVASPNILEMDIFGINQAFNYTGSTNFQNKEEEHAYGDTMTIDESFSFPSIDSNGYVIKFEEQIAIVSEDPDHKDIQPAFVKIQYQYVPLWKVKAIFTAQYTAARPRTEHAVLTLTSDLQEVFTPPSSPTLPVEDIVNIPGADVGVPLRNILNWLSVRDTIVQIGQVIYPANPTIPGGTSFQIAMNTGRTGSGAIPTFSPFVGEPTIDNEVTWVSMGSDSGTTVNDWTQNTYVPVGQMIRPTSGPWYEYYISQETRDLFGVPIINVGFLPDGNHYFLCVQAGTTLTVEDGVPPPTLTGAPGTLISDGEVIWKSLGSGTEVDSLVYIPITYPGARAYFPSDRGHWSIEYLIAVARAHLRLRARVVQVSFECTWERAVDLNCRKTITLFDDRFPGGQVTGKVISYSFKADGDKGLFIGSVTIGCAVGQDGHAVTIEGTATYADGYVDDYQFMEGEFAAANDIADISYSVPLVAGNDDGLTFPLTKNQVTVRDRMHGSLARQQAVIGSAMNLVRADANVGPHPTYDQQRAMANHAYYSVGNQLGLTENSVWWEWEIKSTQGTFEDQFNIQTSLLSIEKQIDMSAPII